MSYSRVAPTPHPPAVKRVSLGGEAVQRQALGPARQGPGRPGSTRALPAARAAALPGQAAARRAGPDCASAAWAGGLRPPPQECLGGSLVFGVSWISPGLTWPHLPPCLLTRADRPTLPWRLWVLASCPSSCPSGRRMRGPAAGSPLPAARWAAGPTARRPGRSGPVAEVQAGLLPSPPVACGRSSWGRGNRPG